MGIVAEVVQNEYREASESGYVMSEMKILLRILASKKQWRKLVMVIDLAERAGGGVSDILEVLHVLRSFIPHIPSLYWMRREYPEDEGYLNSHDHHSRSIITDALHDLAPEDRISWLTRYFSMLLSSQNYVVLKRDVVEMLRCGISYLEINEAYGDSADFNSTHLTLDSLISDVRFR